MANLGALANVPFLGGYLAQGEANRMEQAQQQEQGMKSLAMMAQMQKVKQDQAQLAREQSFREQLTALGPNATEDQIANLGLRSGVLGAKDAVTLAQTKALKIQQMQAQKETALARLNQAAIADRQRYELGLRNAASTEERNRIVQEANQTMARYKAIEAQIHAGNLQYTAGVTVDTSPLTMPQAQEQPKPRGQIQTVMGDGPAVTVPGSDNAVPNERLTEGGAITRIPENEINAAKAAMPGLQVTGQAATPVPAPAPMPVMPATPPTVPPVTNPNLDPRDFRAGVKSEASVTPAAAPVAAPVTPAAPQQPDVNTAVEGFRKQAWFQRMSPKDQAAWVSKYALQQTKPSIAGQGDFTPQALEFVAKQYLRGDRQAVQGFARSATARIALQNAIVDEATKQGISPEETASRIAEFQGIVAGSRTVGQRAANIGLAATEAGEMIGIVKEQSDKFGRSTFVPWNIALRAYETGTGSPEIAAFGASVNALVNVYARAINPTGQPTVSDKEHARAIINTVQSPAQVEAVLGIMRREMEIAKAAPNTVRQGIRNEVTGGGTARPNIDALVEKWSK